jgi:hypothetical protein
LAIYGMLNVYLKIKQNVEIKICYVTNRKIIRL